jgi:hypothetical protein
MERVLGRIGAEKALKSAVREAAAGQPDRLIRLGRG